MKKFILYIVLFPAGAFGMFNRLTRVKNRFARLRHIKNAVKIAKRWSHETQNIKITKKLLHIEQEHLNDELEWAKQSKTLAPAQKSYVLHRISAKQKLIGKKLMALYEIKEDEI